MAHWSPARDGKEGLLLLQLPDGEVVVGHGDEHRVWHRWPTNEVIHPTHFLVLPYPDLWSGKYDAEIPALVTFKEAFPDMAALMEWALSTEQ